MKNIFENAYFGKAYKTRDGRKAIFSRKDGDTFDLETEDSYNPVRSDGSFLYTKEGYESNSDIVSEWQEEPLNEEEYEEKFKSLYESCIYWQAYDEKPELFTKAFKELLDFAPNDKRTIDYFFDMIKSRKTIFNEVNESITSLICHKQEEINEEELDAMAKSINPYPPTRECYSPYLCWNEGFKEGFKRR